LAILFSRSLSASRDVDADTVLPKSLGSTGSTEEMELTWTDLAMDWTNANFILKGIE
jgi:hypothetical protein